MEIKTKYNIGDTIYLMYNNAVSCTSIDKISLTIDREKTTLLYGVYPHMGGSIIWYKEREFFPTKEELLKSL